MGVVVGAPGEWCGGNDPSTLTPIVRGARGDMEIFNIHLLEFLLIAGLGLIIFGPERLPEVGRFLGKQMARFLAWQQQSPELQMINEVRSELDREIASLRDELLKTRTQLDVSGDMETLRNDLRSMVNLRDELTVQTPTPPALDQATVLPKPVHGATPSEVVPAKPVALEGTVPMNGPQPVSSSTAVLNTIDDLPSTSRPLHDAIEAEPDIDHPPPTDPILDVIQSPTSRLVPAAISDHEQILHQLQALSSELQALVDELQQRGLITATWNQRPTEVANNQESHTP